MRRVVTLFGGVEAIRNRPHHRTQAFFMASPSERPPARATNTDINASTDRDILPRQYDKIYILFELEDGTMYWWPTEVNSIQPGVDGSSAINATAELEYAARHKRPREVDTVEFRPDRTVMTKEGETSWCTSAEAADAGNGDMAEKDWCPPQGSPPVRREELMRARDASDAADELNPTKKRRLQQPKKTRRAPGIVTKAQFDTLRESIDKVSMENSKLRSRVETLETMQRVHQQCDHRDIINELVEEKKNIWKMRVLGELDRMVSMINTKTPGTAFHSAIQSGVFKVSDSMSYRSFVHIVKDLAYNPPSSAAGATTFWPSAEELTDARMHVKEAHVIFNSARALLGWLHITAEEDVRKALAKSHKYKTTMEVIRVLGSCRWVDGDQTQPLRVFLGASSGARPGEGTGKKVSTIEYEHARWDQANGVMAAQPVLKDCAVGDLAPTKEARAGDLRSKFTVSWLWKSQLEGRGYSSHARADGVFRLGTVWIRLPYVLFRGNATCENVRNLLEGTVLQSSI